MNHQIEGGKKKTIPLKKNQKKKKTRILEKNLVFPFLLKLSISLSTHKLQGYSKYSVYEFI
jgi:hypothetical protein